MRLSELECGLKSCITPRQAGELGFSRVTMDGRLSDFGNKELRDGIAAEVGGQRDHGQGTHNTLKPPRISVSNND